MAMHIVCTEDAWVMSIMFIPLLLRASKRRLEKPGIPTIPLPSRDMRAMSSELDIPISLFLLLGGFFSISVPGESGSNVFFTYIGIPSFTTGCIVGGYMTLAPKCESSKAAR